MGVLSGWKDATLEELETDAVLDVERWQAQRKAIDAYMRSASAHTSRRRIEAQEVAGSIATYKEECIAEIRRCLTDAASEEDSASLAAQMFGKKQAKRMAELSVSSTVKDQVEAILSRYAGRLSKDVNRYLDTFTADKSLSSELHDVVPFRPERALARAFAFGSEETPGVIGGWLQEQPEYLYTARALGAPSSMISRARSVWSGLRCRVGSAPDGQVPPAYCAAQEGFLEASGRSVKNVGRGRDGLRGCSF